MPCAGPDLEFAEEKSKEAYKEIYELLTTKYGVMQKGAFLTRLLNPAYDKLEEAVKEVFVCDACDGF